MELFAHSFPQVDEVINICVQEVLGDITGVKFQLTDLEVALIFHKSHCKMYNSSFSERLIIMTEHLCLHYPVMMLK